MKDASPEELLAQVKRIVASAGFASSDPTRHLLLYLAEHYVKHPGESVKEITLATEALGKSTNYDPRTDSSVRVLASRLRSKLAEYYTQEGAQDPLLVGLPRGAYSLTATWRMGEPAPLVESLAPLPSPVTTLAPPHWKRPLWMVTGVVLLAAAFAGGYWSAKRSEEPRPEEDTRAFWRHFLTGEPPLVVFSNPRFMGDPNSGFRLLNPTNGSVAGPINSQFTGVGEVSAVHDITRQFRVLGRDVRVKRAQLFSWDDARNSDIVLVGGHEENLPVAQLPPLEKFNLKAESQEPYAKVGAVRNESPLAGEKPYYFSSADAENGTEYAIVALTHGVTPARRVLVLAGVHTFGTAGAAAFVSTPTMIADLYRKLNLRPSDDIVPFEALIELTVRGGSPLPPRLVLVHQRRE